GGAGGEGGKPKPHRDDEEGRADVVAPAHDERGGGNPFGRLDERQPGRHEQWAGQAVRPDQVRERGEDRDRDGSDHAADELQREADPEDPAEAAPPLLRLVAEAVLDHRLVDGQVGEELEEARRSEDEREQPEVVRAELTEGDDAAEEPERGGEIHAGRSRGSAPEDRRAHELQASIVRRSVASRRGSGPPKVAFVYPNPRAELAAQVA